MDSKQSAWHQPLNWASKPFTYRYSQPNAYHYSLDSIEFMWRLGIDLKTRTDLSELRVLDLCSGCGVLGFELNYWVPEKIRSLDFVDVQSAYQTHFEKNVEITGTSNRDFQFHCMNFNQLGTLEKFRKNYDLIVCNPPYFRTQSASLTRLPFRNRCHFFLDGSFTELCGAICDCLAERGEAYILLCDLSAHGIDQFEELKINAGESFEAENIGSVRGTHVARLRRRINT